jgi:hypothetical protein
MVLRRCANPIAHVPQPRLDYLRKGNMINLILGDFFAPQCEGELTQAAIARYQGWPESSNFSLLNGLRHSEMKSDTEDWINWDARQVRVSQGKTGNYKVIGPLGQPQCEFFASFSRH